MELQARETVQRTILFYRDYHGVSGGHLKVRDYFGHVLESAAYAPRIYFTPQSQWNEKNPWWDVRDRKVADWDVTQADAVFLGGVDWLAADAGMLGDTPVLNLIQHVRHARPGDERFRFLRRRAIRICVSTEVEQALRDTGLCNGPLQTITNGIELPKLQHYAADRRRDGLLIAGLKQPELAHTLAQILVAAGIAVQVLVRPLPRAEFLRELGQVGTVLFLPGETEGFYLPALEGMALGVLAICPDCIGNRSFCLDGQNCFRPPYTMEALQAAVHAALTMDAGQRSAMLAAAAHTARQHDIRKERAAFLQILDNLDQLW